jgi:hypothetical protein
MNLSMRFCIAAVKLVELGANPVTTIVLPLTSSAVATVSLARSTLLAVDEAGMAEPRSPVKTSEAVASPEIRARTGFRFLIIEISFRLFKVC